MKLKTAKYIFGAACILMVLFIILCSHTKRMVFGYLGIAFAIIGVVFWVIFGRCPNCGRYLGMIRGHYCPRCGEKIDQ